MLGFAPFSAGLIMILVIFSQYVRYFGTLLIKKIHFALYTNLNYTPIGQK